MMYTNHSAKVYASFSKLRPSLMNIAEIAVCAVIAQFVQLQTSNTVSNGSKVYLISKYSLPSY